MSMIPGGDGYRSEFKDGLQVNSIYEHTLGSGVTVGHQLYAFGTMSAKDGDGTQNVVLTSTSNRFQALTLTADRTFTLPSTGIAAGDSFTFINKTSYKLSLNASGGTAVDNITLGQITVQALQAAPTTASHWMTTFAMSDWYAISGVSQFGSSNGQPFTNTTITRMHMRRIGSCGNLRGRINFTGVPATGVGGLTIRAFTSGMTLMSGHADNQRTVGGHYYSTTQTKFYSVTVNTYMSSTNLEIQLPLTEGTVGILQPANSVPVAYANGDYIEFDALLAINEWSMFS